MNPILRNIIAVVVGFFLGSALNMGVLMLFENIIPPPEGIDTSNMESIARGMTDGLYEIKHFISPFLAHALGTIFGAYLVSMIAANNHMKLALAIGTVFLFLGAYMVFELPSPMWFNVLDLAGAYIPMAWIGWKLSGK